MKNTTRVCGRVRIITTAVASAMMLTMTGCGKEEEPVSSSGWEKIDDGSATESGTTEMETDAVSAGDDGDQELEPIEIQVGRLIVDVPGYYVAGEDNTADAATYAYEVTDTTGSVVFIYTEDVANIDETKFRNGKDILGERVVEILDFDEMTLKDSQTSEYMGMPGFSYDYVIKNDGGTGDMDADIFLDSTEMKMYLLIFVESGNPPRDVAADYGNMMRNAQWAEASAESETTRGSDFATSTEESTANTSSDSSDASGVDPDIKAALDSYESMMNSYCNFMERYENASATDALSLMGDYVKMLSQYTDAMNALSEIDEDSLNADELAYYLDVTNRVSKRLLEVAQ